MTTGRSMTIYNACNLSGTASNDMSLSASRFLELSSTCNLYGSACNDMFLSGFCNLYGSAGYGVQWWAGDHFAVYTSNMSISSSNTGLFAMENVSLTALASNRVTGSMHASLSSCNYVLCAAGNELSLSSCNVLGLVSASLLQLSTQTHSNDASYAMSLAAGTKLSLASGDSLDLSCSREMSLTSYADLSIRSTTNLSIGSSGALNISSVGPASITTESLSTNVMTSATLQHGTDLNVRAASNLRLYVGQGPSSNGAGMSNVVLNVTQDTLALHADAHILQDAGRSFQLSINGARILQATHVPGKRPKVQIDADLEVHGVMDSITVTDTNLRIEDRFVTLAHAPEDGAPLTDPQIGRAGVVVYSLDSTAPKHEKSLTWNQGVAGIDKLAKEDGMCNESFWEVRGGALRLSAVLDDGKRVSWGFRIGNKGQLEVYQIVSQIINGGASNETEVPLACRVVQRFGAM
jgi:hypothetical protein